MSDNEEEQAKETEYKDINHEEVNHAGRQKKSYGSSEDQRDKEAFKMNGHVGRMIRQIDGLRDKKEEQKREVKWGINRSKSYRETSLNNERDVLPTLRRQSSFSETINQDNEQDIRHTLVKRHSCRDIPQINRPDLRPSILGNDSDKETNINGGRYTETQTNKNLYRSQALNTRRNINQTVEEVIKDTNRRFADVETNQYSYWNSTQDERENTVQANDAKKDIGRQQTDRETNLNVYLYRNSTQDNRRNIDKTRHNYLRPKILLDLRRSRMQEQIQILNSEKTEQNIERMTNEPGINNANSAIFESQNAKQGNTTHDNQDTDNENIKQDSYENTRDSFLSLNSYESSNQHYSGTETDDTLVITIVVNICSVPVGFHVWLKLEYKSYMKRNLKRLAHGRGERNSYTF